MIVRICRGGHWPPKAPLADQGWCSAQRIKIIMTAGGSHTIILRCHWCDYFQGFPPVTIRTPWLPLWGSCHEVTERANKTLSAPFRGHLSHRERQVALIRPRSLGTFPQGKAGGERIVTGGNPRRGSRRPLASSQRQSLSRYAVFLKKL